MYELFEHTADLGLRMRATNLDELFVEAARALFAVIVNNPEDIREVEQIDFKIEGSEPDYLLFDWLNELLYAFESRHLLFARFDVRHVAQGLTATAWGEPVDPARHRLEHEVKAITYHQLRVEPTDSGWLAEVIVDI